MIEHGIITHSSSPYNSNVILVDKKDGSKRFVVDYREVNKNSISDTYPLPSVQELLDRCFGCNFFSQLDLASMGIGPFPSTKKIGVKQLSVYLGVNLSSAACLLV
jgi:hypothetical protein